MRKILYLICIIFPLMANAEVNSANISKENAAIHKKINMQCKKYSNIQKSMNCFNDLLDKYIKDGKYRGTEEYAATHYNNLSPEALRMKLNQLRALRKTARSQEESMLRPVTGEITEEGYNSEISWIENRLNGR